MTCLLKLLCVTVSILVPVAWGSALRTLDAHNLGIYGGHAIYIEDAPYMAALFGDYYGFRYFCGGSIIHERFILTAAHCIRSIEDTSSIKVLVGSDNLEQKSGVFLDMEKHLCYKAFIPFGNLNDICLLKLKEPIRFGNKVAKISLPDEDLKLEEGAQVNVTGWGSTDGYYYENNLRQVTIPVESQDNCRKIYVDLTDYKICAGTDGHDACWGDSGGPLTYNNVQIGLVSYGEGCGKHSSVYTRVSKYVKWISKTIKQNL
ncbi:chymotrypsin-1-like [Cydia splendana]|uniref:chymotrypsin-1-like n=1 Tax=Cydia splendana TaxID=1100963 RepID=UPI00300DA7BF